MAQAANIQPLVWNDESSVCDYNSWFQVFEACMKGNKIDVTNTTAEPISGSDQAIALLLVCCGSPLRESINDIRV